MVHEVTRVALAAHGPVVEHVDAAGVRSVAAAVLAVAADAVLVAYRLLKLGAHLVTTPHVEEIAWRQEARERKMGGVEVGGRRRCRSW
jgi:stage V sporulation protein SpoVS